MDEKRFEQLMTDVGMPESHSLYIALKQVANEVKQEIKSAGMLEKLAELEHAQWSHWTKYMLNNLTDENIKRWLRQIETPYAQLTDDEKGSDRWWAIKVIDVIMENDEN